MKKTHFLYIFCTLFLTIAYSCEKSADQSTTGIVAHGGQLKSRDTDACEHCNVNDCCCGFELLDVSGNFTFRVCGLDDGTSNCTASPPSPCAAISGGLAQPTLSPSNPKFAFCQLQGTYFQITNTTGTTAHIRISCHFNYTTITDWTYVNLASGQTYVWGMNSGCEIEQCAP